MGEVNDVAKIGIIGHFGGDKNFLDGQTVKTKTLYHELKKKEKEIICVDTYLNNTNKVKLLFESVMCVLRCETIIILLSGNGMRIYFPMMYWAKKILGRKIFHDVIGGNLSEYVDRFPKYRKYLNSYDENWVEFEGLKIKLEKNGIKNCRVIPNFKRLDISTSQLMIDEEAKHRLCMFSRVMKEKGVADAIYAVHKHNEVSEYKFHLDIWGPIEDKYMDEFEELKKKFSDEVSYWGMVDFRESVETLTNHIALLFPTFWKGEGFPGTIVDAYAASLPVIATDWNANSELVDNFKTGWVYPNTKCIDLESSLEWISSHVDELVAMRKNSYERAKNFLPDNWINLIISKIN